MAGEHSVLARFSPSAGNTAKDQAEKAQDALAASLRQDLKAVVVAELDGACYLGARVADGAESEAVRIVSQQGEVVSNRAEALRVEASLRNSRTSAE